jgi:hypothetical protein
MSVDPGEELGGDIEELFTTHFGCRKLMSKGRGEKDEATTLELLSLFTGKAYCSFRESSRAKLNLIYHKFCVIGIHRYVRQIPRTKPVIGVRVDRDCKALGRRNTHEAA